MLVDEIKKLVNNNAICFISAQFDKFLRLKIVFYSKRLIIVNFFENGF